MSKAKELFNYSAISDDCIKCGKCKPVCTIFSINQDETTSPRGFIDLLGAYNRGDLELDRNAKNIFESCFLCTNCVTACPNDLPTDTIIEEVRSELANKYGIAWYKRAFFYLLRHRAIMDFAAKMGWVFQTCGLKKDESKESQKLRFNLPFIKFDRALPFAKSKSFLNSYPENINNGGKRRVAVFIGCMANYAYTSTGDALVGVLKHLGIDSFIPKKQLCCGAPAYFTGDFDTVEDLTKKNIVYFEKWLDEVEAIIIPEATCSAMITHDWVTFFTNRGELEWVERAKKIVDKTFIATEWLYKNTNLSEELAKRGKRSQLITYHDPCHAKKVQGIYKEPRALIGNNYEIVEMSNSDRCCGFGGVTIQSEKHHLARAAGLPKAKMIEETKAQIVSAECSACRLQLTDSLDANNVDVVFKNPIELIYEALKN